MTILKAVKPLIVSIRRGIEPADNFDRLRDVIDNNLEKTCKELNTRWLVSVCDTYADFGTPLEQRNALFVSMLVNFEKIAQSYVLWKLNYASSLDVPVDNEPQKLALWDGMSSFHLSVGDVTNNLFARTTRLLAVTPHIARMFETVCARMKDHETILGTLDQYHQHVFDTDFEWVKDARYDRWREDGTIPPWKG